MAVTNEQILEFLKTSNLTDAQIVAAMQEANVSPAQVAQAVGLPVEEVATRYVTEQILGQGTTDKWAGQGKGSAQANATDMAKIIVSTGATDIKQFGEITKTIPGYSYETEQGTVDVPEQVVKTFGNKETGKEVPITYGERQTGNAFGGTFDGKGNTGYRVEFDAQGKPLFYTTGASSSDVPSWVKPALILGGAYFGLDAAGLLGGAAGTVGTTGLTMGELAQLDLALGGAGGTAGATSLANALTTGANVGLLSGGADVTTNTARELAAANAGATALTVGGAGTVAGMGGAGGLTAGAGGITGLTTGAGGVTGLTTAGGLAGANTLLGGSTLGSTLGGLTTGVVGSTLGSTLGSTVGSTLGSAVGTGLTAGNLANLFSGGLGTAGSLLQMQQSKEAAQQAQARIDAETAAAKAAAQFRPVGMTTRFGTSQFQVDPVTGQLTSAGYTLSPEAKNAQDRFLTLAGQGLTQAEGAQAQFAPLQTGAQNLFNLGNQYIAQSPESVAQNYLNQQMALLQPNRETELANLQNRLQQQGRGGLSVAQGGTMGATTPELQALYNARAQQEAQLAANAQQYGQQNVLFGAGLLGQGSQAMGQYYGGQTAAYQPYTTALGQVQNLETLAQQPLTMGAALGQQAATAGANVGKLGLTGAQLSTNLATSANATANPYAQALMAAGNPNAMFGQSLGNVFGGLFS